LAHNEGGRRCAGIGVDGLVDFGERLEQASGIPGQEGVVAGPTPFLQYIRDLPGGDRPTIDGADGYVVGESIANGFLTVTFDTPMSHTRFFSHLSLYRDAKYVGRSFADHEYAASKDLPFHFLICVG
jgi:hypothetical protein